MIPNANTALPPLQPMEFDQIRGLAYGACGLDLRWDKRAMVAGRLRRLIQIGGFQTFADYCRHIRGDSTGAALTAMIDALTTNHTAFLREAEHFDFLRRIVAPCLRNRAVVEIWSSACATGEEVWTLAMVLTEALPGKCIRIMGSDISTTALERAREAKYPLSKCRELPAEWLSRYFVALTRYPDELQVCPRLRALATFRRNNLLEGWGQTKHFPVIFCRNVMIYFDQPTRKRVALQLSACLEPGGFLFTGLTESLPAVHHSLEYVGPSVYRKPGPARLGEKSC